MGRGGGGGGGGEGGMGTWEHEKNGEEEGRYMYIFHFVKSLHSSEIDTFYLPISLKL